MLTSKSGWVCFISLLLTACATDYHPEGSYANIPMGGYSDSRTDQNTAIVSFNGNTSTSQRMAETYLIYRSAEVTKNSGYDYFVVSSISTSPININTVTKSNYNNYVVDPARLRTGYSNTISYQSNYETITNTGCYNQLSERCIQHHKVTAVIKMFRGPKPPGIPRSYTADDVIAHLKPATL